MKLYEFNEAIESALFEAIDPETGEIVDESALEKLNALQMEKDEKVESCLIMYKNLLAEAEAINAEKKNLDAREKQAKSKAEWIFRYVEKNLEGEKFSTPKVSVSYRKSESIEIIDESAIPEKYIKVKTTTQPDKTAIKKAIKWGEAVMGAKLVENKNMQVK